ncbi:MAG: twin-arginine translocase TatA/TatE family subunit [Phycisphaerales bacterium]
MFLALGMPQGWEWLIILAIGLLLFGRKLPEVGRSLGRGIVEFKKGIKGIEEEIEAESNPPAPKKQLESDARSVSRGDFSTAPKAAVHAEGEGN